MTRSRTKPPLLKAIVAIDMTIFLILSGFHLYWALGGTRWLAAVLPTNSTGTQRLDPSPTASLLVAFALVFAAMVTVAAGGFFVYKRWKRYARYGMLLIAIVFLLRAIGDLRWVGFFKRVTHTPFAVNDTRFFSPLCLLIALVSFALFLWKDEQ